MKTIKRPRILLADDFPQMLGQIEKLLQNDFEIIGFAHDGGEALQLCLTLNPDILLLDMSMAVLCGLEVASRPKEVGCKSKIIFVTVQAKRYFHHITAVTRHARACSAGEWNDCN
jgi:CheY-like chemotaxis protein